jgi:16S rRNA (guanine527-N7)-methyltransferase
MATIQTLLKEALHQNNLPLPPATQEKLALYLTLIQTWNRVFNLTTITTPKDMVYLHLIDSLIITPHLHGNRFLDVGSGAGLPGIPLAIIHPDQHWTLLDKNSKKTRFLTQVIAELGLKNAQAMHHRCEDFHPPQCFDSILSRAFGTLRLFVETTEHLLCDDGLFIAMKGKYPQEEIDELPERFLLQKTAPLAIKGIDVERHAICLSKK